MSSQTIPVHAADWYVALWQIEHGVHTVSDVGVQTAARNEGPEQVERHKVQGANGSLGAKYDVAQVEHVVAKLPADLSACRNTLECMESHLSGCFRKVLLLRLRLTYLLMLLYF